MSNIFFFPSCPLSTLMEVSVPCKTFVRGQWLWPHLYSSEVRSSVFSYGKWGWCTREDRKIEEGEFKKILIFFLSMSHDIRVWRLVSRVQVPSRGHYSFSLCGICLFSCWLGVKHQTLLPANKNKKYFCFARGTMSTRVTLTWKANTRHEIRPEATWTREFSSYIAWQHNEASRGILISIYSAACQWQQEIKKS